MKQIQTHLAYVATLALAVLAACAGPVSDAGTALQATTPPAAATADDPLLGAWSGRGMDDSRKFVTVGLQVDRDASGMKAVVKYGPPHDCTLAGRRAPADGARMMFTLETSSGGRCDRAKGGRLAMRLVREQHYAYELLPPSGAAIEVGALAR